MNKIIYILFFTIFTFFFTGGYYLNFSNDKINNNKTYMDYSKVDFDFYLEKLKLETGSPILKCDDYKNKTVIYHHRSEHNIFAYVENKEIVLCY